MTMRWACGVSGLPGVAATLKRRCAWPSWAVALEPSNPIAHRLERASVGQKRKIAKNYPLDREKTHR